MYSETKSGVTQLRTCRWPTVIETILLAGIDVRGWSHYRTLYRIAIAREKGLNGETEVARGRHAVVNSPFSWQ